MKWTELYKTSIVDGDGWRVVLFVSGCEHQCAECHNAATWSPEIGKPFNEDIKLTILKELHKDYISGITFSGGDPLFKTNIKEVTEFAKVIKNIFPNKTIWVYTGYLWEGVKELEIMNYIDVLVDGKYDKYKKDLTNSFRGSTNQRIINVKQSIHEGKCVLHE